jgi:hypothetical protein
MSSPIDVIYQLLRAYHMDILNNVILLRYAAPILSRICASYDFLAHDSFSATTGTTMMHLTPAMVNICSNMSISDQDTSSSHQSCLSRVKSRDRFVEDNVTDKNEFIPFPLFYVIPPAARAHSCLLSYDPLPSCHAYIGQHDVRSILQFVNHHCGTHRQSDGTLTPSALRVVQLERKLYLPVAQPVTIPVPSLPAGPILHHNSNDAATQLRRSSCDVLETPPSSDVFMRDYVAAGRPVILRGMASSWLAHKRWSNDYLLSTLTNRTVHVKLGEHNEFEGTELLERWTKEGAQLNVPEYVARQLQSPHRVVCSAP